MATVSGSPWIIDSDNKIFWHLNCAVHQEALCHVTSSLSYTIFSVLFLVLWHSLHDSLSPYRQSYSCAKVTKHHAMKPYWGVKV
jgi:hypothetical protein